VFLDEPLANLDYKLREELREQLPELFAGRGTVVLYATSEPEEALLLGGVTGLMDDGNVVQFGSTSQLYRNPENLMAASVFSDPPINSASVTKFADTITMGEASWAAPTSLSDGDYIVAVRPHHVIPTQSAKHTVKLKGQVLVTELSGSESSAHFRMPSADWVSLSHGVHPYQVGVDHPFYFDPTACFYFAPDGARVIGEPA
jgi:glycerol transport system ATP-binding protein